MSTNSHSKIHIPLGDHFEIQVWADDRDRWECYGYSDKWSEAQDISDHARKSGQLPGIKVRIKKL